jgi:DNA-directed RNA polymerase subunit RPC12/RpoP
MKNQHRHNCPRCGTMLDDGPILYRCAACRRSVYAADLDTEFHTNHKTA